MASLWIRSGYDMKVEVSAETYQVGAHFKALIKAILVAPLKSFERFFRISSFPAGLCVVPPQPSIDRYRSRNSFFGPETFRKLKDRSPVRKVLWVFFCLFLLGGTEEK